MTGWIGTWKVSLRNILGYHPWHLEKLNHRKKIHDSLVFRTNIPQFDESTILAILEIKERFLIMRDTTVLNKNISPAKLFFDNNLNFDRFYYSALSLARKNIYILVG